LIKQSSSQPVTQPFRVTRPGTTPEQRRKRFVTVVIGALAFLTVAVGWTFHAVSESLVDLWTQTLTTMLDADVQSLEIWLENEKRTVSARANARPLRTGVKVLVTLARDEADLKSALGQSEAATRIHEQLENLRAHDDIRGYTVVDPSGLVLLSHNPELVAGRMAPPLLAHLSRAFAGETTVVRPYRGLALLPDLHTSEPVMLVAAPINDDDGRLLGALLFRVDANADFSRILTVARMGESGESYAFDKDGFLLTRSRFREELIETGLLDDDASATAVLQVQVRDPGGDLSSGQVAQAVPSARPLTRMAASAVAGESGVELKPYRNYLGVKVIGAWHWLPAYGFGVATEVHAAQAFRLLRPIGLAFIALALLLVATTIGLIIGVRRISRLNRQVAEVKNLGQYEVTGKIGEGGMAVVYRAKHNLLRRPTAVKVLKPDIVNPENLSRFEQEVQLTSQLTHPNTIEIYDYGHTPDGTFYYAMEYLDGISLAELIVHDGALTPARVIHILGQVCGSLGEAHGIGLVHRDIKPANIVLCERGGIFDTVKVLDFGLVKDLDEGRRLDLTAADVVAGTPQYVAPERFKDPGGIDGRSDLYSLGAVGFNLLTGGDVFKATTSMEMCHHVLNTEAPKPSERVGTPIPAELDELVHGCLAKTPEKRPRSAAQMLSMLDALAVELPWTRANAEMWWQQFRRES
jgi:hypothetical protein